MQYEIKVIAPMQHLGHFLVNKYLKASFYLVLSIDSPSQ